GLLFTSSKLGLILKSNSFVIFIKVCSIYPCTGQYIRKRKTHEEYVAELLEKRGYDMPHRF
ncbi:hypothetical protein, partial [Bacillus toyonensis]|uniref:hypothetical protein n=1 Tax=Bacillus toyonensis TaxID=155322 RepID=UPI0030003261